MAIFLPFFYCFFIFFIDFLIFSRMVECRHHQLLFFHCPVCHPRVRPGHSALWRPRGGQGPVRPGRPAADDGGTAVAALADDPVGICRDRRALPVCRTYPAEHSAVPDREHEPVLHHDRVRMVLPGDGGFRIHHGPGHHRQDRIPDRPLRLCPFQDAAAAVRLVHGGGRHRR